MIVDADSVWQILMIRDAIREHDPDGLAIVDGARHVWGGLEDRYGVLPQGMCLEDTTDSLLAAIKQRNSGDA